jgi:UDP-N-acetylmuramate dehydrogenase
MEDLAKRRRDKQPLNYPSAGSTFKRPEGDFAGRLIQAAGLSGFRVGGAMVSEKHCGFVINYDHATATELYELFRQVRKRVLETSGRELELEVRLLGKFE